jgi:hypothetical protein
MSKIRGGCMCGKVRYSSDAEPGLTAVCHCVDCQKQSGSALSIVVAVPTDAISFEGEMTLYKTDGKETGQAVNRYFCASCGSPLYSDPDVMPGMIFVKAGTLDDTSWLKPELNMWCDTAQPWVAIDDNLPRFPGNPPLG